jgi:hypothetical protein
VKHFSSRTTFELTQAGSICAIPSRAQTSLFQQAQICSPGSFNLGAFASANLFIELILDPIQNGNQALEGLFEVEEKRELSCSRHLDAPSRRHPDYT